MCPEVAVNDQFLPGNIILFKLPEKFKKKSKISLEKSKFVINCLKKSKFLGNLPGKIEILLTRIHDSQISKQIDAS